MPESNSPEPIEWVDFLTTHPPDKERLITNMGRHMTPRSPNFILNTPDLTLHCSSKKCNGERIFQSYSSPGQIPHNQQTACFLRYRCRNCGQITKLYSVQVYWGIGNVSQSPEEVCIEESAIKLGEWPPLGPNIPRKVLNLLEKSDRVLFEQGKRAEGYAMGIGAFAYYRRVVEDQRTRLFDKLIEAAVRLKVSAEVIEDIKHDRDNWQFSQSVEDLKAALPEQLKIQGQNPMALLHAALSRNLHNDTDEACLEAAQDIRLVLTHFAEQLSNILKDRTELEKAVVRLTKI